LVRSASPVQQATLAKVLNAYANEFPEEYFWATGPQAPTLLHNLIFAVTPAVCRDCSSKTPTLVAAN
jgi:hypothetical protein